jgi:thioredoxin reductase
VRDRPLAVYAQGEDALHLTKLVRALSADVVLCTGGPGRVAEADAQWLSRHGVQMVDVPVRRLLGDGDRLHTIEFVNGTVLARDALFVQTTRTQPGDLWRQIGCRLDANGILPVDAEGRTAVAGLFAAGDLVSYARQITLAVTSGTAAAFGIHGELVEEEFR